MICNEIQAKFRFVTSEVLARNFTSFLSSAKILSLIRVILSDLGQINSEIMHFVGVYNRINYPVIICDFVYCLCIGNNQ